MRFAAVPQMQPTGFHLMANSHRCFLQQSTRNSTPVTAETSRTWGLGARLVVLENNPIIYDTQGHRKDEVLELDRRMPDSAPLSLALSAIKNGKPVLKQS